MEEDGLPIIVLNDNSIGEIKRLLFIIDLRDSSLEDVDDDDEVIWRRVVVVSLEDETIPDRSNDLLVL